MTQVDRLTEPTAATGTGPSALRRELEQRFYACGLLRRFRRAAYDEGEQLSLSVTGVVPANTGRVVAEVERFAGGGFAGQVYRVRLRQVEPDDGPLVGLDVGQVYAVKILQPPSALARLFRDFLYFLAYQGAFAAQVNPAAVRVGVLWQKLVRRAAAGRFGSESAVCDTYATFYDQGLRSFGEINEWVDGRIWKFEVDDQLFDRWSFRGSPPPDIKSPEYVHKRLFMRELVRLLHEMGAPELARQYEWWTCKSQPNVLKRLDCDDSAERGLTALDFRAGLALLPVAPMSPADVWLILRGLARGSLVQFDRSDLRRLDRFVSAHAEEFADFRPAIEELRRQEVVYRRSLPDVTHHHVHLLTDASLRRDVRAGTITAWRHLGWLDPQRAAALSGRPGLFALLYLVSVIPLLGRRIVKLWGDAQTREHVRRMLTSWDYLCRTWRGARLEALIVWHRKGRVSDERARRLADRPVRYWLERALVGWWPRAWHRAITDPKWAWARLSERVGFVLRFLREPPFREQWLLEQVEIGRVEGMLTSAEAAKITRQIKDPYIQKYLKCLAVHLCTLPVTQVVMLLAGLLVGGYVLLVRQGGWDQAVGAGAWVAAAIQLMPISPGSISRGLFVLYLMIRERDLRNYYIAAPVAFLHVVGYLAFPLQMVAHDPALARFLAGRWARSAVHIVCLLYTSPSPRDS